MINTSNSVINTSKSVINTDSTESCDGSQPMKFPKCCCFRSIYNKLSSFIFLSMKKHREKVKNTGNFILLREWQPWCVCPSVYRGKGLLRHVQVFQINPFTFSNLRSFYTKRQQKREKNQRTIGKYQKNT